LFALSSSVTGEMLPSDLCSLHQQWLLLPCSMI
jgi:hypothetical protein